MRTVPLDHQSLRTILEAAGLRCTPQRLAVYDHLTRADEHPTAEDVYQAVRGMLPRISLATVYKALEALVETGVAAKLPAAGGEAKARYDARRDPHYHFRCLRTGAVHDLPTHFDNGLITKLDPQLADYLNRQGFHVTGYRLELVGYQESGCGARDAGRGAPDTECIRGEDPCPA
jgi:Fur family transcriptional regulator, peroxide stress response regulator